MELTIVKQERQRIVDNILKSYSNVSSLTVIPRLTAEQFQKSLNTHDILFTPKALSEYLAKAKESKEADFYEKTVKEVSQLEKAIIIDQDSEILVFVKKVKSEDVKV